MWEMDCRSPEATRAFAAALGRVAQPGTVVALVGELGAGKTTFAQGVAQGLGVTEPVVSPTFVLMSEIPGPTPLLHADVYRLSAAELPGIGLEEALESWPGVALVEWADRFAHLLPADHLRVALEVRGEGRAVAVTATGPFHHALCARWQAEVRRGR